MAIAFRHIELIDESRAVKAAGGCNGAPARRLDVSVWYPDTASAGGAPLVIYSHGTWGHAEYASCITRTLAQRGYVVAAPNFPLTSCTSFAKPLRPDISDVAEQIKDVSFVIDRLLSDDSFASRIDARKIGLVGHSLGAVTSYFATFGAQSRDRRIAATALTGAGDPVRAALNPHMSLADMIDASVSVPTLFLAGEHDLFARMTGDPYTAYHRIAKPKYAVMIKGAVHSWFHDADAPPASGKNPDCLFFEAMQPGMKVPGCDERVSLIGPARQHEIMLDALLGFFDGYLKGDGAALERLRGVGERFQEAELTYATA